MHARLTVTLAVVVAALSLACSKGGSRQEDWTAVATYIPWSVQLLQACESFEGTTNDLNRRDIVTSTNNMIRKAEIKNARGVLETLTPGGAEHPDELIVQITVGRDFRFNSQFGKRPVKRGDAVYEGVAGMKQGQCVVFSAKSLESLAVYDQGKMCNPQFLAQFTSIESCPP